MIRTLLAVAATLGVSVVGCGSSNSSSSNSSKTAVLPFTKTSSTSRTTTSSTPTSEQPVNRAVAGAVFGCKQKVQASPWFSASARTQFEAACSRAGRSDATAVEEVVRHICVESAAQSPLPPKEKEYAQKGCRSELEKRHKPAE